MHKKLFLPVAVATAFTLTVSQPALADCCDSVLDCGAAIVTDGVSCAIEEFIDTVKGLITMVHNLMNDATGATQGAIRYAQQSVDSTITDMTSQSETNNAQVAQALADAKRLASEEAQFPVYSAKRVGPSDAANTPATTPTAGTAQRAGAPKNVPQQAGTPAAGASNTMQRKTNAPTQAAARAATPNEQPTAKAAVASDAAVKPLAAPARAYLDQMNRAYAEIQGDKPGADQDFAAVNQQMSNARSSEGAGMKSATQIAADAITAPFNNLLGKLTGMLENPTDLTSPSSMVEAAANSIMANLSVTSDQLVDAITAGPQRAFDQAQTNFDDLASKASRDQRIAAAMDHLFHHRTPAAAAALDSLLPKPQLASAAQRQTRTSLAGNYVSYSTMKNRYTTRRQKAKTDFVQRFSELRTRLTQYESVRAKVRDARAAMPATRASFSSKLASYLNGKTQGEVTAQRDQLIAQAKTRFASNPKIRDGVIALLTSESAKRIEAVRR